VLKPIKKFTEAYIDDAALHSKVWLKHLQDIEQVFQVMRVSGITLKLQKCQFAMPEIKFLWSVGWFWQ